MDMGCWSLMTSDAHGIDIIIDFGKPHSSEMGMM